MERPKKMPYEALLPARELGRLAFLTPDQAEDLTTFLDEEGDRNNASAEVLIHVVARRALELDPHYSFEQAGQLADKLTGFMAKNEKFGGKLIRWAAYWPHGGDTSKVSVPTYLCIVGAQSDMIDPVRDGFYPPKFFEEVVAPSYYVATQQQLVAQQEPYRLPHERLDIVI